MIPVREFYKNYQTNFFKFQQIINLDALENIEYWVEKFEDESKSNDREQIIQIIKSHIRITYLHCIDTLFELIFGLFPRNGIIQDNNLPLILSKNNDSFNKPRITGLATNAEEIINELKQEIKYNNHSTSLLRYIIYYQINADNVVKKEFLKNIDDSIEPILEILSIFAKDLSDKSEYNSLKHALRVFPFTGFFKLSYSIPENIMGRIDFDNAHQFILDSEKEIRIITKNFDSHRDSRLTIIASKLIWNLIKIRGALMTENQEYQECYVYYFNREEFNELEQSVTHKQKLELRLRKPNVP